jgi:hypothetical protein
MYTLYIVFIYIPIPWASNAFQCLIINKYAMKRFRHYKKLGIFQLKKNLLATL